MTVHHTTPPGTATAATATGPGPMTTPLARHALAVLRIAMGFVFLWAFLDKTFGLRYSTTSAHAWIHGGSPTKGFLASVEVGPLRTTYHSIAGTGWADWLFMLGLLGVGIGLLFGVAMRLAAVAGVIMLAMMWFAELPLARHTVTGAATASTNPIVDYHVVYALVLVVLAASYAGSTWGLGARWAHLPFVSHHRVLL